jgi:glyoxylase-like metal-dependent hydrolase (beta-lactamase superfamily II)/rhodanese-related sulfurtransferase
MGFIYKQLNPHYCRTYLIAEEGSKNVVLIDPVLEHLRDYGDLFEKNNYTLRSVIDTHTHADHISGGAALRDVTECDYIMHEKSPAHCPNFRVSDGFVWEMFGTITVQILHTPGHTEDSMSLVFPDHIFTGDTLFLDDGGAGRDDLPGGNPEAHWESLQRILQLPDDLTVFPAHDYRNRQPSTLGRQKKTNPHLQERTKEEFVRYIEDLRLGPADWMKDVLAANYACARDPKAAWVPVDAPACEVKGTLEKGVNEIEVSAIPPSVLRQKLNAKQPILLLDVREEKELYGELGHIKGIVHIPIGSLAHRLSEIDKDKEIVSICRSGARAHTAAQILKKARFPSVSVLAGGMIAWNKQT